MKIAIGTNIIDGPWGGGNQFAKSLTDYLQAAGWSVVHELADSDIDFILMTEPRRELKSSAFGPEEIKQYLRRHPQVVVAHRINECDERKGTKDVNDILMTANKVADHTIFISDWLKGLFAGYKDFSENNSVVIRNGADHHIFNRDGYQRWDGVAALRIVTHHWGGNWMKGFDIYEQLDAMIPNGIGGKQLEFTYIGNVPEGFEFKNTKLLEPLSGKALAAAIKQSHVYVSGSQNEPGGMHHIEGCLCGLPPVYRISGALTEHCRDFGVGFNGPQDFPQALGQMVSRYAEFESRMASYPYTAEHMCEQYKQLFENLVSLGKPKPAGGLFNRIKSFIN